MSSIRIKHAEDLDQFCSDGGGSRIVNRNGMCPFSEIVLDEPEDSSFDGMIWHTQDIYSNHLPWTTNQNIGQWSGCGCGELDILTCCALVTIGVDIYRHVDPITHCEYSCQGFVVP